MRDGDRAAREYDAMAAEYSADSDNGVFNAFYERPAMISFLGDVTGKRVLDVGSGAGQLSAELIARGASITGIDVSPVMVAMARDRLGDRAVFGVHDLTDPLPLETDSFDVVVASLVMHYLEDWVPTLREMRRVLAPSGVMALSTHHPTMDWKLHGRDDYFAKKQSTETWTKGGKPFDVTTWRRPLSAMSDEIREAGFFIAAIEEPMPDPALADVEPSTYRYLTTHPHFLFVKLVASVG